MAKEDLDKIQAELKAAIQNHQILVGKMQFDPQNPSYKKQLHDLQIEITSLDDRQKVIVQILRKELVNKQQTSNQASSLNTNASQHQHQAQTQQQQVHLQKQQPQTHSPQQVHAVPQQMHVSQPQSNSVQRQQSQSPMQQPHTVQRQSPSPQRQTHATVQQQSQSPQRQLQSHPVQLPCQSPQQLPCQSPQQPQSPHQHIHIVQQSQSSQQQLQPMQQHPHSHSQPATSSPQQAPTAVVATTQPPAAAGPLQSADFIKKNDNVKCPSILNTPHSRVSSPTVNNSVSSRSTSPPIRVPQYTISKTLLQNKNQMAPPNVLPPKRTCTETELGDIKKTVDKKPPITCDEKNVKSSQNMLRKLQYMASLDLVTPETLKGKMEEKYNNEICRKRAMERLMIDGTLRDPWHKGMMGGGRELQSKRSERKRRSTANPQFSYSLESDRKRMNYLVGSNITTGTKRPRGRPPKHGTSPTNSRPGTPDSSDSNASIKNGIVNGSSDDIHDGLCFVCQKAGRLLICDGCGMAYHPTCLEPPVATFPNGPWRCYKCQNEKNSTGGSVTLDIVHNYIINKTAKDEERKKLQRRNTELNNERIQLETNTKQLSQSLYQCIQQKQELMNTNKKVQQSADNINNFLQIFQS
ncbi:PHD finger protein 21A isoform X2 [Octopus bimaculoides]|nr:PHD finger protein 21A isoform X2 [Octopus bimaculoides]|eukprot:XP_014779927.1 PREDICTED: PHD finger protein 21A-like isoform X1 [Octopus bimaculoides]